jgi:hypothetical protein
MPWLVVIERRILITLAGLTLKRRAVGLIPPPSVSAARIWPERDAGRLAVQ